MKLIYFLLGFLIFSMVLLPTADRPFKIYHYEAGLFEGRILRYVQYEGINGAVHHARQDILDLRKNYNFVLNSGEMIKNE